MKLKKPLNRKNYGSIPHLTGSVCVDDSDHFITPGQERILTEKKRDKHDIIIVTEKIDGANCGIANINGEIVVLTRSGYNALELDQFLGTIDSGRLQYMRFAKFISQRASIQKDILSILKPGERIAGELVLKTHSTKYDLTFFDYLPFIPFDIFDADNKRISYYDFLGKIDLMGGLFKHVNILNDGLPIPINEAIKRLDGNEKTIDLENGEIPEGVVYRVERKGVFDFAAKYVRKLPGKYLKEDVWNVGVEVTRNKLYTWLDYRNV